MPRPRMQGTARGHPARPRAELRRPKLARQLPRAQFRLPARVVSWPLSPHVRRCGERGGGVVVLLCS
eukprot:6205342-Pleurochrysis_carterae.AAC.4